MPLAPAPGAIRSVRPSWASRKAPPSVDVTFAEQAGQDAWQVPDLDTLWSDAQVVDLDSSVQADGDGSDAALAALEF